MRNFKKGLPIPVTVTKNYRKIFPVLAPLILFAFCVWLDPLAANDHKRSRSHHHRYEKVTGKHDYDDQKRRRLKKQDKGNELTGQTAAWLLVAANLSVVLSIFIKGVNRFLPLEPETKSTMKKFNQFQKKHLMRFHYVLNPSALCIAGLHFLLSSCRKSSLPEWGLLLALMMVFLGLTVKFKVAHKWMGRFIYRLHSSPALLAALILVLIVGHLIVD
jgi:hypothetical protein